MPCSCDNKRAKDLDAIIKLAKLLTKLDKSKRIVVKVGGDYYRILLPNEWDGEIVKTIIITKNGIVKAI